MAYEHKENQGSLWPPGEKTPDFVQLSGDINIEGNLYWITLYKKDPEKPEQKHFNVSVKRKQQPTPAAAGGEDQIPF